MAMYLKFGNVKGNVTADGYAGQIALTRVKLGVAAKQYAVLLRQGKKVGAARSIHPTDF